MAPRTVLALALVAFVGCGDGTDSDLQAVAAGSDQGLFVEMLAEGPLRVGWNRIYYRLTDETTGQLVNEAHIEQQPEMRMDTHAHGSPFVDPATTADDEGRFAAQVVYTMPSDEGTWRHELTIHRSATATTHALVFDDLAVGPGMHEALPLDDPPSDRALLVTLTFLEAPRTGLVPFVLTAHEREAPFEFPPHADLDITVAPFMPAHGHGSTGSLDPTHIGDGVYEGAINFNMPGWWTLDFEIAGVGSVQFEVTF